MQKILVTKARIDWVLGKRIDEFAPVVAGALGDEKADCLIKKVKLAILQGDYFRAGGVVIDEIITPLRTRIHSGEVEDPDEREAMAKAIAHGEEVFHFIYFTTHLLYDL